MSLIEILISLALASYLILSALGLIINLLKFHKQIEDNIQNQTLKINFFHLIHSQFLNKDGNINFQKNNITLKTNYCLFSSPPCNVTYILNTNSTLFIENNLTFVLPFKLKYYKKNDLIFLSIGNDTLSIRSKI